MGKRTAGSFERRKQDAYDTPETCLHALMPHLKPETRFIEPCAGKGDLVRHLEERGHRCVGAYDIAPRADGIARRDATKFNAAKHYYVSDAFITNPPWTREILHAIILNLYWQLPTWLLFDADWAHTDQSRPYMPLCTKIVSVGRVKWIEDSKDKGVDNAAWYCFERTSPPPIFIGRK